MGINCPNNKCKRWNFEKKYSIDHFDFFSLIWTKFAVKWDFDIVGPSLDFINTVCIANDSQQQNKSFSYKKIGFDLFCLFATAK